MPRVDWKCIRYAQKELCIKKRIRLDEFRKAWVKRFGEPSSDSDRRFLEQGIKDFYEDYLTSGELDLQGYFQSIEGSSSAGEHIT